MAESKEWGRHAGEVWRIMLDNVSFDEQSGAQAARRYLQRMNHGGQSAEIMITAAAESIRELLDKVRRDASNGNIAGR